MPTHMSAGHFHGLFALLFPPEAMSLISGYHIMALHGLLLFFKNPVQA